jgi:type VI secretion system protein
MALRLRIVSEQRRSLGELSTIVFGVTGGTIGRAPDNDWVLPDPHRYVSSHHARVHFRQGVYELEDLSTNGVFLNDRDHPIGRNTKHKLKDGDLVRIGRYEMLASVDAATDFPADAGSMIARDVIAGSRGDHASTAGDIGASINLESLLADDVSPSDSFRAVNAFGQAVPLPVASEPESDIDRRAEAVSRRMARLARAARERDNGKGAGLYDVQTGLAAFCRGAGIDAERLPAEAQTRMLHLAGQLFREALLGLKDLERHQHELRNRFRIEPPPPAAEAPFTLERGSVDDLVLRLLESHESRRIDGVQWLRERFLEARGHGKSVNAATRAAFVEFIDRLDPAELEARFERALKKGKLTPAQRGPFWDLYTEFYRNLSEMPPDHLPHVFVEAFAKAYLESLTDPKANAGS